jgi:DNA-directed RNA polymerase specialized sigma24 family protein
MPADPWVVFTEGIVAETPQGLTVILGRARNGDERAREMRIDHARRRAAGRRGGVRRRVALDAVVDDFEGQRLDVVAVHEALDRLADPDGRRAQVMTLRHSGGMTVAEVAAALGVSVTTVEQDWRLARAWLAGQLGGGDR